MARRNRPPRQATEDRALVLIEKGFNLLKDIPAATLALYLIGTLPFCLGLVYFWMDMSRSPFAGNHQVLAAVAMTLLFFWMKIFQSHFVRHLTAHVRMESLPAASLRERVLSDVRQCTIQGTGLILLPLSAALLFPFCWVYAFYQSCLYYGSDRKIKTGAMFKQAAKKSTLWPMQNHAIIWLINPLILFLVSAIILITLPNIQADGSSTWLAINLLLLLILTTLISPLTVVTSLNLLTVIVLVPVLIRMLLGIETMASQNMNAMLNSSTLVLLCCLVYMILDPLIKATYVLRCFYGDSILSGEDLRAGLLRAKNRKAQVAAIALGACAMFCTLPQPSEAAVPDATQLAEAPPAGDGKQLRENINEELEKPMYSWRLPRERKTADGDNQIADTLDAKFEAALKKLGKGLERLIERWIDWMDRGGRGRARPVGSLPIAWDTLLESLAWIAGIVLIIAVIITLLKHFRPVALPPPEPEPNYATPNLEDENISADDLPMDEWMQLAMEMLGKGDTRLAVRALFLSGLAFLGEKRLLQIKRFKSNREYLRELNRRAHVAGHQEINQAFEWSVNEFEGIWYGDHEATQSLFDAFMENLKNIKKEETA